MRSQILSFPVFSKNSTVVRLLSDLSTKSFPIAFKTLDRAAPELGAIWAEKLFLTPPKYNPPEAETQILESGHRFTIDLEGVPVAAWSWGDGPTVFLVHGWGGRGGQLSQFVQPLVDAGFSAVLFDAPGHGQTPGETSSAVQFTKALFSVIQAAGPAHAVIAHSLGSVATTYGLRKGLKTPRTVFIGAPQGTEDFTATLREHLGVSAEIIDRMTRRIEKRFNVSWEQFSMTLPPEEATRLLVVHDRDDKEVPWESAQAIAQSWNSAELHLTEGLGHRRILRSPEVIHRIVEFVSSGTGSAYGRTQKENSNARKKDDSESP